MSNDYTGKIVGSADMTDEIVYFIENGAATCNLNYGRKFKWYDIDVREMAKECIFFVCFRDGKPVGFLLATMGPSIFDPNLKILSQQLLYSIPGTRASLLLLKMFIDFGHVYADHILTTIGTETNIKSSSLERLGFKKLEEKYRIEVIR